MNKHETRSTPETDEEERIDNGDTHPLLEFARKLERERDEAREENSLLKKAPLRQKCQQLERDVDHWCDMHTVAHKERNELRDQLARMQTMAVSVADIIAKREAMLEAVAETHKILLSIQLNDIFEETMRNHACLAIEKLKPFLP